MKQYKLDFGKDTVENIIYRRNNRELSFYGDFIFKDKKYLEYGIKVGYYSYGAHSLFIHSKQGIGHKIFLGLNRVWTKKKRVQVVYNFDRIIEIRKIYDILYSYNLCPKVYNIFSVKILFNDHDEVYEGYGLKMERIIEKKSYKEDVLRKNFMKREKEEFLNKLETVCKNNFIVRLTFPDRKKIRIGEKTTGYYLTDTREIFKNKNSIYAEEGYILIDIDPLVFINEGFIERNFIF